MSRCFKQDAGDLFITHYFVDFKERKIIPFEANKMLSMQQYYVIDVPALLLQLRICCVAKYIVAEF